ncbi:hypothetical protein [Moraxella lacunata]|uniref:hypothetical protein n=1 Tax=Moraxella lacunata TaxID=477 RepID=UPI003EDED0EA
MHYTLKHYGDKMFKRLTGVSKDLFTQMVEVIKEAYHNSMVGCVIRTNMFLGIVNG